MASLRTFAFCVLTSVGLVAPLNGASAASVGGGGVITVDLFLTAGEECVVHFSNPELAGTTITVEVHDGMGGDPEEIEIELDENGEGDGTWVVKNWESAMAVFDHESAASETSAIQ